MLKTKTGFLAPTPMAAYRLLRDTPGTRTWSYDQVHRQLTGRSAMTCELALRIVDLLMYNDHQVAAFIREVVARRLQHTHQGRGQEEP